MDNDKPKISYLLLCRKLSLIIFVDEALIQKRYQRIRIDMGGELELPLRLVDPPLLLQLGGRLSIICGGQSHLTRLDVLKLDVAKRQREKKKKKKKADRAGAHT